MKTKDEMRNKIFHGNCLDVLKQFPDCCVSAVVTDPPYGLSKSPNMREVLKHWLAGDDYEHSSSGFMGKNWDSFVPGPKIWEEIYRVLKPGGHVFSFSGTRTYDLMVTAMRLASLEIRDKIDYHYDEQQLMKFSGYTSFTHAQGFPKSLNISKALEKQGADPETVKKWEGYGTCLKPAHEPIAIFTKGDDAPPNADANFYYCAKASSSERDAGCFDLYWKDGHELITEEEYTKLNGENEAHKDDKSFKPHLIQPGNIHPTVKPIKLMRYLVKMVKYPEDNLILDPFAGSGSTLVACALEGVDFVGIEMEESSVKIAETRVQHALQSIGGTR